MLKIDTKIYGSLKRENLLKSLQKQLNLPRSEIFLDDRPNGGNAYYTAKKAWLAPVEEGITHRLAFPDDMKICNNFYEILYQIVKTHPEKIISLYPPSIYYKKEWAKFLKTPYIYPISLAGCGVVMPIEYIEPMFKWIDKTYADKIDTIADDTAMENWAKKEGIKVISTVPSLVQHMGDVSLEDPSRPIRRTPFFEENPKADWSNPNIEYLYDHNYNPKKFNKEMHKIMRKRGK